MDALAVRLELHHHSAISPIQPGYLQGLSGQHGSQTTQPFFYLCKSEGRIRLQSHADIQSIRLIRRHDSASPELLRMTCVLVSTVTSLRGTQQALDKLYCLQLDDRQRLHGQFYCLQTHPRIDGTYSAYHRLVKGFGVLFSQGSFAANPDKRNVSDRHFGPVDAVKVRHAATSHRTLKLANLRIWLLVHTQGRNLLQSAWLPHFPLLASSLPSLPRSVFFQARMHLSFCDVMSRSITQIPDSKLQMYFCVWGTIQSQGSNPELLFYV